MYLLFCEHNLRFSKVHILSRRYFSNFFLMLFVLSSLLPTSYTRNCLIQPTRQFFKSNWRLKMDLKPPESVKGLTQLDKKLFEKPLQIMLLTTLKGVKIPILLPRIKKYLLKVHNLKPVQLIDDEVHIYLNPILVKEWSNLLAEDQKSLQELSINESNFKVKDITLGYENFSVEDIFRAVLPSDKEGMASFTKVGHIVHVNLREHLLPYKDLIGQVLLDKVAGCKTVVNKTDIIDNTYRNFKMEVLKGADDMVTTVKTNACVFKFDFSKVYWNSRLSTEHERILNKLEPRDVLCDVFAGVGPFSIPAARRMCLVYANDLNPESFMWLKYSAGLNSLPHGSFTAFNKDGRDFIREDFKALLPGLVRENRKVYITMNLPALAVEFLKYFVGLFKESELPEIVFPPVLFVYCFAKGEDYVAIATDLVKDHFGFDVADNIENVFRVRTVSSFKEMMRVTVRLDRNILVGKVAGQKRKLEDGLESDEKKCKDDDKHGEKQEET